MFKRKREYRIIIHSPKGKKRYWQFLQKYSRNKAIKKLLMIIDKQDLPTVLNMQANLVNIPPWPRRPWIQMPPNDLAEVRKDVKFIKVYDPGNVPHDKYFQIDY